MTMLELRSHRGDVELRLDESGDKAVARGYAAVFGSRSENLGGFVEMIDPKAFNRTLNSADVRALRDHDPKLLLGRSGAGTLRLWVDERGLAYEIDLPDTQEGRDTAVLLRRGDLYGSSFGFRTIDDDWSQRTEDGYPLRVLQEVALRDVGPVTMPAYPATEAALRSLAELRSLDLAELVAAAERDELRSLLTVADDVEPEKPSPLVVRRNWRVR